jgi:outer membrane immunogenic protein
MTAAGLFGSAAPALADGYERGVYAPRFSWSGFYVGINGGYGFGAGSDAVIVTETVNTVFSASGNFGSLDIAGPFGGAQIGYNAQMGSLVLGLEADIQVGDIADSSHGVVNDFLPGGLNATVDTTNRVGWFGTLRPRIGFAWDRTLVYATGGFAFGDVRHSMRFVDNFGFTGQDTTRSSQVGYTVGGGIEHAISAGWSLKAEYQYIDLGTQHYTAPLLFTAGGGAATVFAENTDTRTDFHTVRIGLNWKWDDRRGAPLK